jgi:hypothetical protein
MLRPKCLKKSKKNPLTKKDKRNHQQLSKERVLNENVIDSLKRFKILCDCYRIEVGKMSFERSLLIFFLSLTKKLEQFFTFEKGLLKKE